MTYSLINLAYDKRFTKEEKYSILLTHHKHFFSKISIRRDIEIMIAAAIIMTIIKSYE